jgi:crossover junction endodeoxyribonuclease RuvC
VENQDKKIIVLGIDPGTCITGYGLICLSVGKIEPVDYGCIRPPVGLPLHERYRIIFEATEQLIQKHRPSVMAIETQFVLKNAQSAIKLGMARGMAVLAAARANLELHEYAPKRAKQAVVGNGSASKAQVGRMIGALLHLPEIPEPEDAADALALAICYANTRKNVCMNSSRAS